jgi:uncharacterized membrane protein
LTELRKDGGCSGHSLSAIIRWGSKNVIRGEHIHRISGRVVITLSLIALLAVLTGYLQPRHTPEGDEGAAAHIFQLSIAAVVPIILVFLATGDWKRPWQSVKPLALPAGFLGAAFTALYYLEHYYLAP